jgi:hypothetical protein
MDFKSSIELEIRATTCLNGEDIEACYEDEAENFSVYVGKPGSFCFLLDVPTFEEALKFAVDCSNIWEIPFIDRVARR